jgi:hypothetical protein
MKHFFLSLFVVAALFVMTNVGWSQSGQGSNILHPEGEGGFLIGPFGGVNLISYKTDVFPILNSEPSCFTAQNGSDVSFIVGLSAAIPLGEGMQSFIVLEAALDNLSSKFTTANNTRADIPTKINGIVANGSITTSETASLNYLLINAGYKYNFTSGPSPVGPGIVLALSFGLPVTATLNKTVSVTAADSSGKVQGATINNTQTTNDPVKSGSVSTGLRIGLRAQFDYDIPLTENGTWTATPAVGYDLPFTKVDNSSRNWSASNVYGIILLRYFVGR